ncbi:MAG: phosphate ABC transporter permease subunit PstC [Spirochaetales bacterium]|uniref:Phosphate transport system permease protein n=1 Tax=Candidatus Thalassospirochaeta sargassi TaxID=3119039 RepID=A0AAJ1IGF6_9SPIO|nr:phosphate ABC transporter permease subunit PstC [Spirochaetales bacterium]
MINTDKKKRVMEKAIKNRARKEKSVEIVLLICALVSVISVLFISVFIFGEGLPLFKAVSVGDFLFGTDWAPSNEENPRYGILPFIVGSIYITLGALLLAVPIGIMTAVFMAEIADKRAVEVMRSVVQLLAGIPSVIYGFFGVIVISKLIRETFGGTGYSVLSGAIILAIMVLPTIINITEVTITSLPKSIKEGSLALGGTRWQTIFKVQLPAAKSGIIAGVVLAMGRALGETMAVLMVAGNAPIMPTGPLSKVRTLTMNIVTDMGYASGDHRTALFTTSIVLFLFILILNLSVNIIKGNPEEIA